MELQQLLTEIENVMKLDVRTYSTKYKVLYFEAFNRHFNGCTCNQNPMKEALRAFYDKNKNNI